MWYSILIAVLAAYLLGNLNGAVCMSTLLAGEDVRKHGSGNLGGSNTGRVLGKKAGLAVMTLDILKVTLVVFLSIVISDHPCAMALGAVCAAIGHCYPVFLRFRGGKAVATMYGFFFGLWVCAGYSPLTFFLPLVTFLVVLYLFKIVALSSMLSAVSGVIYIWCVSTHPSVTAAAVIFALLIILRHHENVRRMIQGNENKIHWM